MKTATVEFSAVRQKTFGEEDTPSVIQSNLKDAGYEIYNSKSFKDFLACTNPPTYSCPSNCQTVFKFYPELVISPPNAEVPTESSIKYSKSGSFSIFLGANGANALSGKVVEILKDLAKTISDQYPCPDGYSRQVTITVDSYTLEPVTIPITGILIGYNVKINYTITIKCVKSDKNPTYADLTLKVTGIKECVSKT